MAARGFRFRSRAQPTVYPVTPPDSIVKRFRLTPTPNAR
jgi:hypothetical protein